MRGGLLRARAGLLMLVSLGLVIYLASDPRTWRWLASERESTTDTESARRPETNSPNDEKAAALTVQGTAAEPLDRDPHESAMLTKELGAVGDRSGLGVEEMPAYRRLFSWSDARSFDSMRKDAATNVLFTQIWERPDQYRGKLIALRLHVVRSIKYQADETPSWARTVHELWGATDESKSLPYVVVCDELPTAFPQGHDVREEIEFVGYFFKVMSYQATDKERAAPLLIGRVKWIPRRDKPFTSKGSGTFWLAIGVGGVALLVVAGTWIWARRAPSAKMIGTVKPPVDESAYADWIDRVGGLKLPGEEPDYGKKNEDEE